MCLSSGALSEPQPHRVDRASPQAGGAGGASGAPVRDEPPARAGRLQPGAVRARAREARGAASRLQRHQGPGGPPDQQADRTQGPFSSGYVQCCTER